MVDKEGLPQFELSVIFITLYEGTKGLKLVTPVVSFLSGQYVQATAVAQTTREMTRDAL